MTMHPIANILKFELAWGDLLIERVSVPNNKCGDSIYYLCPCGWTSPWFDHCSAFNTIPEGIYNLIFLHVMKVEGGDLADPNTALPASMTLTYPMHYISSPVLSSYSDQVQTEYLVFTQLKVPVYEALPLFDTIDIDAIQALKIEYCYECQTCHWRCSQFLAKAYIPHLIQKQLEHHAQGHKEKLLSSLM